MTFSTSKQILTTIPFPYVLLKPEHNRYTIIESNPCFNALWSNSNYNGACLLSFFSWNSIVAEQLKNQLNNTIKSKSAQKLVINKRQYLGRDNNEDGMFEISTIPIFDTENKISMIAHYVKEIDTNENRVHSELLLAKERYRSLFELSPLPMWTYDIFTLEFVEVNEAAIKHYGYSKDEFLSMTVKDIRPKDDIHILEKALEEVKKHNHYYSDNVYRHLKKNGDVIYVRIKSNIINIDGRKLDLVLAVDITGELEANIKLEEYTIKLEAAQTISSIGYWNRDLNKGISFWSEQVYEIFEQDKSTFDITYEKLKELFHPDDKHLLDIDLEDNFEEGKTYEFTHRIITGEGNIKWVSQRLRLIYKNAKAVKIEGVIMDITQRKKNEESITTKSLYLSAINRFITGLLQEENWTSSLNSSFAIIGAAASVDRVYYFQNHKDVKTEEWLTSQKVEWTKDSTSPQIDNSDLQNIPLSAFEDFMYPLQNKKPYKAIVNTLPESNTKSTLQAQSIKSILVVPIYTQGEFHGFVGFDDCTTERQWNEEETDFLTTIANNLASAIEKVNAEALIEKQTRQLNTVINNIPGIVYRCLEDKDWTMLYLSDEFKRLTGYNIEDILHNKKRSYASIIHPDDIESTYNIFRKIREKKPFELEYRIICASKEIIWVKEQGRGTYDKNGNLECIDGVIMDITSSKIQEKELKLSNERFNLVMETSQIAIMDWDLESNKTYWGKAFEGIYGYDLSQYDNYLWSKNIHPDDRTTVLNTLQRTIDSNALNDFTANFKFLKADGSTAYVKHRGLFIRNERGKVVRAIGVMFDLTDILEKQAVIKAKNNALLEIAWIQSHIVRAPLARILGLIGLIDRSMLSQNETEIIDGLHESANELDNVIHEVVKKSEQVYK